ncbi:MAG: hypothetical protein V9G98_14580 [Candidatus Competibacter sp.]
MSKFSDLMKPALFNLYHNQIRAENHNIDLLRNVWRNRLNNGRNILQTEDDINTYLACYFELHFCKLNYFLEKINFSFNENINLFDWGCGSATGTLAFLNQFHGQINLNKIILIEPSTVAINRGKQYLDIFLDSEEVKPSIQLWNRNFESLIANKSDFIQANSATNFHLFSNILDVEAIDISSLCDFILETQTGWNHFLCVSTTGRAAASASTRINQFYSHLCFHEHSVQMIIDLGQYQTTTPPILFINNNTTQSRSIRMFGGYFAIDFGDNKNNQLIEEIKQLNYNIQEKKIKLEEQQKLIDKLNEKLQDQQNPASQKREYVISDSNRRINELNSEITALKIFISEKDSKINEQKEIIYEKSSAVAFAKNQISQLHNEIQEKDNQLLILRKDLSEKNIRITELERDNQELFDKNKKIFKADVKPKVAFANNQISQPHNEIQEKDNQLLILRKDLSEKNTRITQLERDNIDKNKKIFKADVKLKNSQALSVFLFLLFIVAMISILPNVKAL